MRKMEGGRSFVRKSVLLIYGKLHSSDSGKQLRMLNHDSLFPNCKILGQFWKTEYFYNSNFMDEEKGSGNLIVL